MPAYNFKKEFAGAVKSGEKCQTIRKKRKRSTKSGELLFLYTGMRTKDCVKLCNVICKSVQEIFIVGNCGISVDGIWLNNREIDNLAKEDGFSGVSSFLDFFDSQYDLPFSGEIIKW